MERRFGYFVFGGLVIGALLGMLFSAASRNIAMGVVVGALIGLAIGWFAGAADARGMLGRK